MCKKFDTNTYISEDDVCAVVTKSLDFIYFSSVVVVQLLKIDSLNGFIKPVQSLKYS